MFLHFDAVLAAVLWKSNALTCYSCIGCTSADGASTMTSDSYTACSVRYVYYILKK